MRALEIATGLGRFKQRGAGTDAERRAAGWLADQLRAAGRPATIETFWCRPNWALAHAWHMALALAGSLVSVPSPRVGGGLLLAALAFILSDALTGLSPGRRLTPESASQNVIAPPPDAADTDPDRLRLIITAGYDTPRAGLVHRPAVRRPLSRLRRLAGPVTPGWLGWLVIAIVWLEIIAILRLRGDQGHAISFAQLPPTLAVVLALAALLELAGAGWSPGSAEATAPGVALALAKALDTTPFRHLDVELVLTGTGNAGGIGLRRYLHSRRRDRTRRNTAVLGVAPCAAGTAGWWRSDGPLVPLRYSPRLLRLAEQVAGDPDSPHLITWDGRGAAPALAARLARLPALSIGCPELADGAISPSSATDPAAADDALQFGLMLVDAIESELARAGPAVTPA